MGGIRCCCGGSLLFDAEFLSLLLGILGKLRYSSQDFLVYVGHRNLLAK
jgi:hypothetical protein